MTIPRKPRPPRIEEIDHGNHVVAYSADRRALAVLQFPRPYAKPARYTVTRVRDGEHIVSTDNGGAARAAFRRIARAEAGDR